MDASDSNESQQNKGTTKHSYTISCGSAFRDAVEALAQKRRVNVGDIARSVLLVVPPAVISEFSDPGEPDNQDRETVILKSGPSQGRPWRRKPRLQVRMAPGYDPIFIRRALNLALALDRGEFHMSLQDPNKPAPEVTAAPPPPPPPAPEPPPEPIHIAPAIPDAVHEELERLRTIVNVLSFEPLSGGINNRDEALHILGFPPGARPDTRMIRARFRMLATIHHPDSNYGSHHRMSQLNQAMEFLR